MTSLESLSREAAKVLPDTFLGEKWELAWEADLGSNDEEAGQFTGEVISSDRGTCWLHESTEACTEIMVRVLWANKVKIEGSTVNPPGSGGYMRYPAPDGGRVTDWICNHNNDPMLAFRVAVLKALIALKGQK